jgi:hypothetical protein
MYPLHDPYEDLQVEYDGYVESALLWAYDMDIVMYVEGEMFEKTADVCFVLEYHENCVRLVYNKTGDNYEAQVFAGSMRDVSDGIGKQNFDGNTLKTWMNEYGDRWLCHLIKQFHIE